MAYAGHVSAYNASQSLLCVNGNSNTPPTSKLCNMEVQWTNIGMRDLQHNSTYVTLNITIVILLLLFFVLSARVIAYCIRDLGLLTLWILLTLIWVLS